MAAGVQDSTYFLRGPAESEADYKQRMMDYANHQNAIAAQNATSSNSAVGQDFFKKSPTETDEQYKQRMLDYGNKVRAESGLAPIIPSKVSPALVAGISDANPVNTEETTASDVEPEAGQGSFEPQSNVLNGFASTSYAISIYILNKDQSNKNTYLYEPMPNRNLIIQTGGIDMTERNPFFGVDFYINDLNIESLIGTKDGGRVSNAVNLTFKITEPYGITFIDRLAHAIQDITRSADEPEGNTNYPTQPLLMVIKFYGYDIEGNIVSTDMSGSTGPAITKYIPFIMTKCTFKVTGRHTEYECEGVPWNQTANNTAFASIPFNLEFAATTVKDFLNNTASEKASDKGIIVSGGLAAALTDFQRKLAEDKHYTDYDEYIFVLPNDGEGKKLGEGKLRRPGPKTDKSRTGMANTLDQTTDQYVMKKGWVATDSRVYTLAAGQSILNVLDTLIRSSTYITNQQKKITGEHGEVSAQLDVPVTKWYRVLPKVEIKKFDPIRNYNTCKYIYHIEPYTINDTKTEAFESSTLKGVHKAYNYWYTGENTDIIQYEQEYNYAYFTSISNKSQPAVRSSTTNIGLAKAPKHHMAESTESTQSALSDVARQASEAASVLYSIGDTASISLKIIGDPAWIQTESFNPVGITPTGPFTPDGSINGNVGQVYISIKYHLPSDYNLSTGLQDKYDENNLYLDAEHTVLFNPTYQQNYMVTKVTHHFNNGSFTQDIEAYLANPEILDESASKAAQTSTPVKSSETALSDARGGGVTSTGKAVKLENGGTFLDIGTKPGTGIIPDITPRAPSIVPNIVPPKPNIVPNPPTKLSPVVARSMPGFEFMNAQTKAHSDDAGTNR